jgi:hypothetical protein
MACATQTSAKIKAAILVNGFISHTPCHHCQTINIQTALFSDELNIIIALFIFFERGKIHSVIYYAFEILLS